MSSFNNQCQVLVTDIMFHPMRCISSCSTFSPSVTLPWAHSSIDILLSSCRAVISVKPDQREVRMTWTDKGLGKGLTTNEQTLTSLSHWSASQSQFHHHGREESLRLKFNTLKYQLSKPEPKFCLKKKQSFWETSFSTGSFPFACASFQVIIHAPIPRRVIDGYASK